ncbi:bromodomain-containing protein 8-like isoform X3 [Clytia hemisphaerica]|uniref:bromodomain-containing protein 8-like isoform X3 n=1 Tax=Clytia hemisphaerica TaxID=252671 RepID=UPI0034D53996
MAVQHLEEWSSQENFTLACCVARNGDQNWVSVSRNMRSVTESCGDVNKRPADFFSQKNCAHRYNQLLGTALTAKRKSRSSVDSANITETPSEQVYRKLTFANIEELNDTIQKERERFQKLKSDLLRIQNGEMDEKIFDMWNSIQSGEAVPLENLVPDENPPTKKDSSLLKHQQATSSATNLSEHKTDSAPSSNNSTPSRPQRQTKETEKFKSYIEQRQKHNAKYHHHPTTTTSTTIASPVTPMTAIKMSQTPVTVSSHSTSSQLTAATNVASSPAAAPSSNLVPGPTPVQVQNMITPTSSSSKPTSSLQGLLILKSDQQRNTTQQPSPTTPKEPSTTASTGTSFLSSLLTAPTNDIKAQVTKITEVLKEPAETRLGIHHVTDEAYEAYRKAQHHVPVVSPAKTDAPVLSKLLVQPGSVNNSPQVSPSPTSSKKTAITPNKTLLKPITTTSTVTTPIVSKPQIKAATPVPAPAKAHVADAAPTVTTKPKQTPVIEVKEKTKLEEKSKPQVKEEKKIEEPKKEEAVKVTKEEKKENLKKKNSQPTVAEKVEVKEPAPKKEEEEKKEAEKKEAVKVVKVKDEEKVTEPVTTKSIPPVAKEPITKQVPAVAKATVSKEQAELKKVDPKKTSPLTIEIKEEKVDLNESTDSLNEPPPKKRAIDAEVVDSITEAVAPSPKQIKGKRKGRQARGGRRKTSSGSMKIELPLEDSVEKSDIDLDASAELDELDYDRKIRPPLTPSMCSSPASPALSVGSNCDPEQAQQQRAWRKSIMLVWKAAASHKYANVFLHPVTDEEAPGYSTIIFRPMDLSLIKKNIETGVITTTTEFQRDIMLMFQNALMYNRKEHDVYRMAQEMRDDVMEQIQSFISTQLMLQTSGERDAKNLRTKQEGPVKRVAKT